MTEQEDRIDDISLEFQRVLDSIDSWVKANDNNVSFVASFTVFDEEGNVLDKDDRILAFGYKDICKIHLEELGEELDKEKDDAFVNW